jgi:hypothetical protein
MSISAPGTDVRRIAGHIGAEITGVRVAADLPGDVFGIVRQALHEHKVVLPPTRASPRNCGPWPRPCGHCTPTITTTRSRPAAA